MAIRIRLKRIGKKKQSYYRIVVADVRFPRDGRSIEEIGLYDPNQDPAKVDINKERLEYWMGNGATLTPTVENILKSRPSITDKSKIKMQK
ncbi:30S ribosomal protein S16 [bacterium]|nr:30S ribosomal protein S16 [bacterium]